jgi:hypothetical protein
MEQRPPVILDRLMPVITLQPRRTRSRRISRSRAPVAGEQARAPVQVIDAGVLATELPPADRLLP